MSSRALFFCPLPDKVVELDGDGTADEDTVQLTSTYQQFPVMVEKDLGVGEIQTTS